MKKKFLKNLKSIREFKQKINKTYIFIHGLESTIGATEAVLDFTKARSSPDYKKFKNLLEFDDSRKAYLFELGFIALFANFEFFMSDFLKELFLKYPSSFESEKMIRFEEIDDFKNITEIKRYFVDSVAIEKSYDIKSWLDYLDKKFGIKIFKTKKQLHGFLMLNALRNIFMHAGGKTNSKFRNEMKTFLKAKVSSGQEVSLDRKKYFEVLYYELNCIIKNLKKN